MPEKSNKNNSKKISKSKKEKISLDFKIDRLVRVFTDFGARSADENHIVWNRTENDQDTHLDYLTNSFRAILVWSGFGLPVSKVELFNVKSLYDVNFESKNLNIFAGKNSSGKSSILETIALISKWAFSTNSQYEGIPFGADFGTLSFSEFRSFKKEKEPIIIKFTLDNIIENIPNRSTLSNVVAGKCELTFELNDINYKNFSNLSSNLKFAPIDKLTISIEQDEQKLKDIPGLRAINGKYEFINNYDERIKLDLIKSYNLFSNHVSLTQQNLASLYFGVSDVKEIFSTKIEKSNDLYKYSSYADIDTSLIGEKASKSRIYGVYFDSPSKSIKHLLPNEIDGFVPLKKEYLIKWLAIDYVQSNYKLSSHLINDFFPSEKINRLLEIRETLIEEVVNKYKEQIDNSENMASRLVEIAPEISQIDGQLNIRIENSLVPESRNVLRQFYENEGTDELDNLNQMYIEGYFEESVHNYLLSWLEGDAPKLNEIKEIKLKDIDKLPDNELIDEWKEVLTKNYGKLSNFLNLISEKLINQTMTNIDNNEKNPCKDLYKTIDEFVRDNGKLFPLIFDWNKTKFPLLEFLSHIEHDSSTYLAPLVSEKKFDKDIRERMGRDIGVKTPEYFSENLNKGLEKGFKESFASTIFIGPLRERFLRDDDIFTFNFPFVLGKSGELTGSFLGTFGDKKIEFPTPSFIKNKKMKKQSIFKHLSEWLNHIGVAENIYLKDNYVIVQQNKNDLKLENVGVGVSQVLPILVSAMITTTNKDGEILLLEQPELHLHPHAQANLGDFFVSVSLANKKSLFIETHSEHLVNRVKTKKVQIHEDNEKIKIYFASKNKDKTELQNMQIGNRGEYLVDNYPEGFFDQAQKEAYSLMEQISESEDK